MEKAIENFFSLVWWVAQWLFALFLLVCALTAILADDRWYLVNDSFPDTPLYQDLPVAYQTAGGEVKCEMLAAEIRQKYNARSSCRRVSLPRHWFNVVMYNAEKRPKGQPLWLHWF